MTDTSGTGIGVPTDSSGNADWTGDPVGTDPINPGLPMGQQESQAVALYNSNPALQAYVQQTFGDMAWALNDPELLSVIVTAATEQWSQADFDAALGQTQWWSQNGQAVRSWQELQGSDPATAQQEVAANSATIANQALTMGVQLSQSQLTNMATQASMFQWNSDQITQAIRGSYTYTSGQAQIGTAAQMQQTIQAVAGQYLTTADPNMIKFWTTAAIKGNQTPTQLQSVLQNYLGQQASQRFPWMTAAIQQGMTPQDYLQPYTTQAAQTLGIAPDSINWTDPKWTGALLQTQTDGQQTPLNVDQFNKNLMKTPAFGYQNTQNARNAAFSMAKTIEQTFGKIAS